MGAERRESGEVTERAILRRRVAVPRRRMREGWDVKGRSVVRGGRESCRVGFKRCSRI